MIIGKKKNNNNSRNVIFIHEQDQPVNWDIYNVELRLKLMQVFFGSFHEMDARLPLRV